MPASAPDPRTFARALRATIDAHLAADRDRARLPELVEWTELIAHSIDEYVAHLTRMDEREGLVLWLELQAFVERLLLDLAGDAHAAELSVRASAAARTIGAVSLVHAKRKGARA